MADARFTPRAEADLRHIWRSIAPHNEAAADRLLLRLFERVALAADNPAMGARRPELGAETRLLVEGSYIVIYEPEAGGVVVVAIVHGMRDPSRWLD